MGPYSAQWVYFPAPGSTKGACGSDLRLAVGVGLATKPRGSNYPNVGLSGPMYDGCDGCWDRLP